MRLLSPSRPRSVTTAAAAAGPQPGELPLVDVRFVRVEGGMLASTPGGLPTAIRRAAGAGRS